MTACIIRLRDAHVLADADGRPRALGGVIDCQGRAFVVLNTLGDCSQFGTAMLWAMKRMVRGQPPPLYVQCQPAYPQAPRLLAWLGFQPTDEILNGAPVWAILR